MVDAAEIAVEEREAGALGEFIADDYRDADGRTAADVRRFLHGWLIAHPSASLFTRIDSIELEGTELARLQATVGILGRDSYLYRLDLRLALEDGEWRVIRAARQGGG